MKLTIETSGLLTRRHRLSLAEQAIGEISFAATTTATFTEVGGRQVRFGRLSPFRHEYEMEGEGEQASARLLPLRQRMEVRFQGETFTLQSVEARLRAWELAKEGDKPLVTIRRGGWGQPPQVDIDASVKPALLAFAYYLVMMRWRASRRMRIG